MYAHKLIRKSSELTVYKVKATRWCTLLKVLPCKIKFPENMRSYFAQPANGQHPHQPTPYLHSALLITSSSAERERTFNLPSHTPNRPCPESNSTLLAQPRHAREARACHPTTAVDPAVMRAYMWTY